MSGAPAFKLVEAGFSPTQVEALAAALLRSDPLEVGRLDGRIDALDRRLNEVEHRLEAKIATAQMDTVKWAFGLPLAQTGGLLAGVTMLLHRLFTG